MGRSETRRCRTRERGNLHQLTQSNLRQPTQQMTRGDGIVSSALKIIVAEATGWPTQSVCFGTQNDGYTSGRLPRVNPTRVPLAKLGRAIAAGIVCCAHVGDSTRTSELLQLSIRDNITII